MHVISGAKMAKFSYTLGKFIFLYLVVKDDKGLVFFNSTAGGGVKIPKTEKHFAPPRKARKTLHTPSKFFKKISHPLKFCSTIASPTFGMLLMFYMITFLFFSLFIYYSWIYYALANKM